MTQLELAEQYVSSTSVSLFLTGKAGTGKTTFLRHIVATTHKRCVVLAPTGVAAVNAGGVTIHSFFQLPLCPYLPDVKELVTEYQMPERKFKSLRKEKVRLIRSLDLIIIDEISMVRADLLDAVDMTLRRYRRSGKPFGGVQLLMIGDVQQLPPVVTDEEKPYIDQVYSSPFFFNSKALRRLQYMTIVLTKIFRQQDEDFIGLLNSIRDNRFDMGTLRVLNARYQPNFDPPDSEGYIRLTTHNYQSNRINQQKLAAIDSKPFELAALIDGNFPESSYPTDAALTLKRGAQVMFVKNDVNGHEYYNGKLATVEGYDAEEGIAVVDGEGNHIVVGRERWENIKYEIDPRDGEIKQQVDGTFVQYPLRLAWAITIHKSQGLTFDKVIIDAASAFTYGQVYVALSRCRTLQGLVLASPISERCAFDCEDILDFNRSLPSPESAAHSLATMQSSYFEDLVHELFDFSQLLHDVERLNSFFQQHLRRLYPLEAQKMSQLASGPIVDMLSVSERFHKQLIRMQITCNHATDDPAVIERIGKGVAYFDSQLHQILLTAAPLLEMNVTSKTFRADFEEFSADLVNDIGLKQLCFKRIMDEGFSIDTYNKAKSDFLVQKEFDTSPQKTVKRSRFKKKKEPQEPKPARMRQRMEMRERPSVTAQEVERVGQRPLTRIEVIHTEPVEVERPATPKAPDKEPRTASWQVAAQLFNQGMTMEEVAAARGVKVATVETYLIRAIEEGYVALDKVIAFSELGEIVDYIRAHNPATLKEIHEYFGARYSYLKIRAASIYAKGLRMPKETMGM